MRCDAVIRELAVPTDERDSAGLAEHVAHCPACAAWAKRAAGLDRLWEATRPPEPSAEVWDALWGHMAHSLDASMPHGVDSFTPVVPSSSGSPSRDETQVPSLPRARSRTRRWAAIGLIGLAQAAAVLLAVGLAWRGFAPSQPPQVALVADPTHSPSGSRSGAGTSLLPEGKGLQRFEAPHITVASEAIPVVVEQGSLVVIHADPKPTVVHRNPTGRSFGFDGGFDEWYFAFNAVEALAANPVVAME